MHPARGIIKQTDMADINSFGGYTIPTLQEKRCDGINGIAYCPICDKAEESHDDGNHQEQAVTISIGKVRIHMRLVHRVKNVSAILPHAQTDAC